MRATDRLRMFSGEERRVSSLTALRDAAYIVLHGVFLYRFASRSYWLCVGDQYASAPEWFAGFVGLSLLLLVVPMWGLVAAGARPLATASATTFLLLLGTAGLFDLSVDRGTVPVTILAVCCLTGHVLVLLRSTLAAQLDDAAGEASPRS